MATSQKTSSAHNSDTDEELKPKMEEVIEEYGHEIPEEGELVIDLPEEDQDMEAGSSKVFRPIVENAEEPEVLIEDDGDSEWEDQFDFEEKIKQVFDSPQLNERITWPERLKNHPILAKYPNPTVYEADLLQIIVDIKEKQEMKKLKNKQEQQVDVVDYHQNMARIYPSNNDNRPDELVFRRARNTVAARRSRAKNKVSEKQLKRDALKRFVEVENSIVNVAKLELYCNELHKMLGEPEVDWETWETVHKVHDWNKKHS